MAKIEIYFEGALVGQGIARTSFTRDLQPVYEIGYSVPVVFEVPPGTMSFHFALVTWAGEPEKPWGRRLVVVEKEPGMTRTYSKARVTAISHTSTSSGGTSVSTGVTIKAQEEPHVHCN